MKSFHWISFLLLILLPISAFAHDTCTEGIEANGPFLKSMKPSGFTPAVDTRSPGSLTTIFDSNGGYRGNMFDIEPISHINEITGLDVNVDPVGQTVTVDVYWREGTCVGHDQDPTDWDLLGSATTTAAGYNLPTFIDLHGNGVEFEAGQIYGMYVDVTTYPDCGINYTNGGPNTYSNADLELTTYYGKGTPAFTGSSFFPRIWNGTVYYETGLPDPLRVDPDLIEAWYGGVFEFDLFGDGLGNRKYALFATSTGYVPGTPLPGGLTLPINWDWFTQIIIDLAISGSPLTNNFLGTLDNDGYATAELTVPGHWLLLMDLSVGFAWCTYQPSDFVSNAVQAMIAGTSPPPPFFIYDDGTAENALSLTAGGDVCWIHWFDVIPGHPSKLVTVKTAFGYPGGNSPPAGTPAAVYVWDDPTNDGNPVDAVLMAEVATTVQDPGTNIFLEVDVGEVPLGESFFIGAMCEQAVGEYAAPMDEDGSGYNGEAWIVGDTDYNFNPNDLSANNVPPVEVGSIGFGAYWLLRAWGDY